MQAEVIPITRLSAPDLDLMWEYYPVVSRYGVNAQSLKTAVKSCKEVPRVTATLHLAAIRGIFKFPITRPACLAGFFIGKHYRWCWFGVLVAPSRNQRGGTKTLTRVCR